MLVKQDHGKSFAVLSKNNDELKRQKETVEKQLFEALAKTQSQEKDR